MLGNYNRLAIDIGEKTITIAEGKLKNNRIEIYNLLITETPEGLVNDGRIENVDELAKFIKATIKKSKMYGSYANITLKYSKMIMKDVYIPVVQQSEVKDILKLVLYEELALAVEDFDMQYKIMEKKTIDNTLQYRIKVFILPKDMPQMYYDLVKKIGLRPKSLSPNTDNIINIFNSKYQINNKIINKDKTYCLIDLDKDAMNLMMINRNEVKYHRNISYGESDLDLEIAKQLGIFLDDAEVIRVEYLKQKNINSTDEIMSNLGLDKDIIETLEEVLIGHQRTIAMEINDAMNIYLRTNSENQIETILTYGNHDSIYGITKHLSELSRIDSEVIKTIEEMKIKKIKDLRNYISVVSAIGTK